MVQTEYRIDEEMLRSISEKATKDAVKKLVDIRQRLNLSQRVIEERVGMKKSNVSRLEKGGCSPSISTIAEYAAALGYRVELSLIKEEDVPEEAYLK